MKINHIINKTMAALCCISLLSTSLTPLYAFDLLSNNKSYSTGDLDGFFYSLSFKERLLIAQSLRIFPDDYNNVPVEKVESAIYEGIIDRDSYTNEELKKQLMWHHSHWFTYGFKNTDEIDYPEIVREIAEDLDLNTKYRSISQLEESITQEVIKQRFDSLWGELDRLGRMKMLAKLNSEQGLGLSSNEIAGMALGSSAAVLGTIGTTMAMTGFAFYTTMSSLICAAGATLGLTFSFGTYMGASSTAAALGGPVGWCVGGVMLIATPFMFGWADAEPVQDFIMMKHLIEVSPHL